MVNGAFWNMGENCSASSRLIVHAEVREALLERIGAQLREWRMGDPLDPRNRLGALVSPAHFEKVRAYLDQARTERLAVRFGGATEAGIFVEPTVVDGVSPHSRLFREEIFGPLLSVTSFDDIDEAIKLGDKVAVFKSGRLLQYDHPDTLLAHPADEFVSAFTGQDSTLKRLLLVRAEDAADSSLVTARPQTPVAEALELMDENDRRYLIVVDDQGKGLGYVRRKDLRRQEGTCAPFVTPFRVTASHDEHLRILLSRMYEFNSSWLPVLDPDQQFLGEVTQESIADYLSSGRSRGGKGLIVSPAEQVGA